MSIKPQPHENKKNDPLPSYPFKGTFPDEGEEGIDLSDMPKGLGFYIPAEKTAGDEAEGEADEGADKKTEEGFGAWLYLSLKRQRPSLIDKDGNGELDDYEDDPGDDPESPDYDEHDPDGWRRNLKIPNLSFRVGYHTSDMSDDLAPKPNAQEDTGPWILSRPLAEVLRDMEDPENPEAPIKKDDENKDNPFSIYTAPSLPELKSGKAIPLKHLAETLNEALVGGKEGPVYFEYEMELASVPGEEEGTKETGEILLYKDMLEKKIVASVDLLILMPMIFKAYPGPDAAEGAPVTVIFNPDLGDEDMFGRKTPDDNEFFDMVTSFGFNIAAKNIAGLSAGKLFLENTTDVKKLKYRLPLLDFANHRGNVSLGGGEMEKIKAIWPFVPRVAIEFEPGEEVRIQRNFNIELQSITVKAGGEYTFETGL
jgi:hypothetical protein